MPSQTVGAITAKATTAMTARKRGRLRTGLVRDTLAGNKEPGTVNCHPADSRRSRAQQNRAHAPKAKDLRIPRRSERPGQLCDYPRTVSTGQCALQTTSWAIAHGRWVALRGVSDL